MKNKILPSAAVLVCMSLLYPASPNAGEPLNLVAVLFNNVARIVQDPILPVRIDGLAPVPGYAWYEPRISLVSGPPQDLNPRIEVSSSIAPSNFLRPPGRVIPSPYDLATFSITSPEAGNFAYASQWAQLFAPRDARNTVVLALVSRGDSLLFSTNFDLQYSLDPEVIQESMGIQTVTIQLTPRADNQQIIVRLRSQATRQADPQFVAGTASPPPSSQTSTSVIWNMTNPAVGKTLTFTVQDEIRNFASPTGVRYVPSLTITSSPGGKGVGTAVGDTVTFPKEFLPEGIDRVQYSVSQVANWILSRADRTLVDIREVTELVP